ncbi:trypsin-like serine protease [Streptomyces sp. TRM76323]|uniref:Trypsin-like serine protease n=1 Tax=Streptomyces tamarix TaxID=3078565 RepID=A0ABU3QE22_9ACTN|nr:trypsin-like serine protease [Streptomyces tamarix]MDT9681020.1 trypsin-like serine protease [Streptomyces tamarix]
MRFFGWSIPAAAAAAALVGGMLAAPPAHAVVGGSEVGGEGDWMVQVHVTLPDGTKRLCGGAAVGGNLKVLTSAGCVAGAKEIRVASGLARLATDSDWPPQLDDVAIPGSEAELSWVHPQYEPATGRNDVALVSALGHLNTHVTVRLTTSDDTASYAPGTPATFRGWGSTSGTSSKPAPSVREATLPLRADAECATALGAAWEPGRMFCAGEPATGADTGTVAPCTGDEGGPLVVRGRLVGIYSRGTGPGCTSEGGQAVFTKVSAFVGELAPRIQATSLDGDARADLFAMTPDGKAYHYNSTGSGLSAPVRQRELPSTYTRFRQADLDGDGAQDHIFRDAAGDLYWRHWAVVEIDSWGYPESYEEYTTKLGSGFNAMRSITVPGDVTGDGTPDIVTVDADGVQWVYPFKAPWGGLLPRIKTGTGWGSLTSFGSGDYTGDGKPDLLTRDTAGKLWLYQGTGIGATPWKNRVQIGTGWNYTAYAASGDANGDAKADFFVRDADGVLWLYKGTGNLAAPLHNRVKVGSGWNAYNLIG